MSYEEEDTCVSYEEEDACVPRMYSRIYDKVFTCSVAEGRHVSKET